MQLHASRSRLRASKVSLIIVEYVVQRSKCGKVLPVSDYGVPR